MMKKLFLTISTVLVTVMFAQASAFAYPIANNHYNGIFFNNAEVLLDKDGSKSITIGDTFWGTVQVQQIKDAGGDISGQTGPTIWNLGATPDEITGYFATDVIDIGLPGAALTIGGLPNNPISTASLTIATIILGAAATDPNSILAPGDVMRIYEDFSGMDYNDSSQALALSTAVTGIDNILHSSLGLAGGYWYTLAPTVPPGSGDVGESFAGLNYITSPFGSLSINDPNEDYSSGAGFVGGLSVDMFFNSEIFSLGNFGGPNGTTKMHFGSNDPAVQEPTVIPEPSTLLLLGVGLLSTAIVIRKRVKGLK